MKQFLILLTLHLLYDFHWQGPFIAEMKRKSFFFLFIHALTYGLTLFTGALIVAPIGASATTALIGTHFIIDFFKVSLDRGQPGGKAMYLDQLAHLIVLVAVVWLKEVLP